MVMSAYSIVRLPARKMCSLYEEWNLTMKFEMGAIGRIWGWENPKSRSVSPSPQSTNIPSISLMRYSLSFGNRLLSVGRFWAVLALVVMLGDVFLESRYGCPERDGSICQPRNVFEQVGIFNRRDSSLAPGEWGMTGDENSRYRDWVEFLLVKETRNDDAGVEYVCLFDLFGRLWFRNRNRTVEVVGVGGTQAGNRLAGLRP